MKRAALLLIAAVLNGAFPAYSIARPPQITRQMEQCYVVGQMATLLVLDAGSRTQAELYAMIRGRNAWTTKPDWTSLAPADIRLLDGLAWLLAESSWREITPQQKFALSKQAGMQAYLSCMSRP